MKFIGIDLEGVLVPEIWVALAEKTGIKDLFLTTKDIGSYKTLMKKRIEVLNNNNIKSDLLFEVAKTIEPYEGAVEFLEKIKEKYQIIVLSDTFYNLSAPIIKKLGNPNVFCHELLVDDNNMVSGVNMCIDNHKMLTIKYMNALNFDTIAIGDSLNDIGMLEEANHAILFKSSPEIIEKYKNFFSCNNYNSLSNKIDDFFSL